MKKNITIHSVFLIFSLFIVLASLYVPKTVYSDNDLAGVECGWPVSFVYGPSFQNPPFPWQKSCIGFLGSAWESQIQFLWFPFFLDVTIVFGLLKLSTSGFKLMHRKFYS